MIACVGHESAASWTASLRIIEVGADVQPAVLVDAEMSGPTRCTKPIERNGFRPIRPASGNAPRPYVYNGWCEHDIVVDRASA